MKHPLEFLPEKLRMPLLVFFFAAALAIALVFRFFDVPGGIVAYEMAGNVKNAADLLKTWDEAARLKAAFGLGFDYLFMPVYALGISLWTLLAAGRHTGWLKSLGSVAGWGAFVAASFDAVENAALWQILSRGAADPWPMIAAVCASVKFFFFFAGILVALGECLLPKRK